MTMGNCFLLFIVIYSMAGVLSVKNYIDYLDAYPRRKTSGHVHTAILAHLLWPVVAVSLILSLWREDA